MEVVIICLDPRRDGRLEGGGRANADGEGEVDRRKAEETRAKAIQGASEGERVREEEQVAEVVGGIHVGFDGDAKRVVQVLNSSRGNIALCRQGMPLKRCIGTSEAQLGKDNG